jgi:phenylacetate-coenzyme A ligase PaaK-like adenylate-forming protein
VQEQIDALIHGPQYATPQAEKDAALTPILRALCREVAGRCPPYRRFLDKFGGDPDAWAAPADVPPLPVSMFKHFLLSAVPPEKVVRELHSSATTGQQPSRIVVDKTTAFRQARALVSILKEHIGNQRRPFLVLDAADSLTEGDSLTARGAAIRGVGNFASETVFGMDRSRDGGLAANWERIDGFFARHGGGPVLAFGFTFIVWTEAILLHSGGWKKLAAEAVSKDELSRRTAAVLGADPRRILDFYGMVEQVGTVFVDCENGNKHAPAFADVIFRRPLTLLPAGPGESGIIEVLSVLPTSYPGQALLTEDQGVLLGVDDCPCGRKGEYFRFTSRIEQAEVRGCGDTFAQSRELR